MSIATQKVEARMSRSVAWNLCVPSVPVCPTVPTALAIARLISMDEDNQTARCGGCASRQTWRDFSRCHSAVQTLAFSSVLGYSIQHKYAVCQEMRAPWRKFASRFISRHDNNDNWRNGQRQRVYQWQRSSDAHSIPTWHGMIPSISPPSPSPKQGTTIHPPLERPDSYPHFWEVA